MSINTTKICAMNEDKILRLQIWKHGEKLPFLNMLIDFYNEDEKGNLTFKNDNVTIHLEEEEWSYYTVTELELML